LADLPPRHFEHLVEHLYRKMGYATILTPLQRDGGRDVLAEAREPGKLTHLRIECKRHARPVGVELVRALLGVVSDEKVNKGVLVTTSTFTRGAHQLAERNPRIELIGGRQLVHLLNEHLGPHWPARLDAIIHRSKLRHGA